MPLVRINPSLTHWPFGVRPRRRQANVTVVILEVIHLQPRQQRCVLIFIASAARTALTRVITCAEIKPKFEALAVDVLDHRLQAIREGALVHD